MATLCATLREHAEYWVSFFDNEPVLLRSDPGCKEQILHVLGLLLGKDTRASRSPGTRIALLFKA